jgi:SH3-like domain-containing protein
MTILTAADKQRAIAFGRAALDAAESAGTTIDRAEYSVEFDTIAGGFPVAVIRVTLEWRDLDLERGSAFWKGANI